MAKQTLDASLSAKPSIFLPFQPIPPFLHQQERRDFLSPLLRTKPIMKTYLTIAALCLAFWAPNLLAQQANRVRQELSQLGIAPSPEMARNLEQAAAKTQTFIPAMALGFNWDTITMDWDTTLRFAYTYQGGITIPETITQEMKMSNGWQLLNRQTHTWDANGYLSTYLYQRYIGGHWDTTFYSAQSQDSEGNLIEYLSLFAGIGPLDTSTYEYHHLTYDNTGAVIADSMEYWDSGSRTIEIAGKGISEYNLAGELETYTWHEWTGNGWFPTYRKRDYIWHDYAEERAESYVHDFYNGATWVPAEVNEWQWSQRGSYTKTISKYNNATVSFDPWRQEIFQLDSNLHRTLFELYDWDDSQQDWDLDYGFRYTNTYNNDGALLNYVEQFQGIDANSYSNFHRREYMDFVLDREEFELEQISVAWAPHPAGQQVALVVESEQAGQMQVEVMDVQGKMLRKYDLVQGKGRQRHEMTLNLPGGLYLYRTILNGKAHTGRLLVQ